MTYAVQPFRLAPVHLREAAPLSKICCDSRGESPGLFGQFGNCEAEDLEYMHKIIRSQTTVRVLRV